MIINAIDSLSLLLLQIVSDESFIYVALIFFVALLLRSAIGFGDGLIAIPLLTFFIDLREAVPLLIALSTTISFSSVWQDRKSIQIDSLKRTSISALVGIPAGIVLLSFGNESLVKAILGFFLIIMAVWKLLPSSSGTLKGQAWSYVFGGLAGMLGSAYALRGIVFTIYGGLKGWSQAEFKSTISGFYIISGIFIPIGYLSAGLITSKLVGMYFIFLPLTYLATVVGGALTNKLNAESFKTVIWVFLLIFGVVLMLRVFSN